MSNLTTDSIKYQSEIKNRLTGNFDNAWRPLWIYSEMSQLINYAFSYSFLIKGQISNHKLIHRKWINNLSDETRLGIYRIDSIKIKEEEINCSLNQIFEIQELAKRELSTSHYEGIVLDGHDNQFIDFKLKKYFNWNLDEEMNENLAELVSKIKMIKTT